MKRTGRLSNDMIRERINKTACAIKTFELDNLVLKWWNRSSAAERLSFISAFIIGFLSHLFVYTGRYYGRDDMGFIFRSYPMVGTGRWFNDIINKLNLGYVIPLTSGIFVTLFLALSAYYVCKLFQIRKKSSAVLIAGLMTTFPSIANTNLFLYETPNYHFAVFLAVFAVYVTAKYKFGFLVGGVCGMLTLAIYQSKFNIVLTLCLFYLIMQLLQDDVVVRNIFSKTIRFVLMGGLSAASYLISLPLSLWYHNATLNNYRGFSGESMTNRLLTISGLRDALESTYRNYFAGFFGNIYLIVDTLKHVQVVLAILGIVFVFMLLLHKNKRMNVLRGAIIIVLLMLVPFASNFSNFFDTGDAYGLMIYAFVFTYVFLVCICERCTNLYPLIKSIFFICIVFVIGNFIVGNNVYYLKAYYFNQRTFSLTTRVLSRIDPLIPLSNSKEVTFFGGLPNEYYPESRYVFREFGSIREGSALGYTSYINYAMPNSFSLKQFVTNIDNMHGVKLQSLDWGSRRDAIEKLMLDRNMPVWPSDGSVDLIDGVIVVNFGITDIVFEEDAIGQFFRARHWVSEGNATRKYTYHWNLQRNGVEIGSWITSDARLYVNIPSSNDNYRASVKIQNVDEKYQYPVASMELSAGTYAASQDILLNYLESIVDEGHIIALSVKDDASSSLDEATQEALWGLGLKENLVGKHRHGYVAIIDGHNVVYEVLSEDRIECAQVICEHNIEVVSAGYAAGNVSRICIDGIERSRNGRGINLVVFDKLTGKIVDSITFDTCSPLHTLSR